MTLRGLRAVAVCGLCVALASPVFAQKPGKGKGKGKGKRNDAVSTAMETVFGFPADIELTADQTKKVDSLKKEFGSKVEAAAKKADENSVLTPEQKSKREEAMRTAKADGKKGKEVRIAAETAASLTEEQIKKLDTAKEELKKVEESTREKVVAVLTDEQKSKLKPASTGKKKKKVKNP